MTGPPVPDNTPGVTNGSAEQARSAPHGANHTDPRRGLPDRKLAGYIARSIEALNRTDDAILDVAPHQRLELDRRMEALRDRIAALEEAASHERATSPAGAALQLMLVSEAVSNLEGSDTARHRVERLLVSVVGFLEAAGGFKASAATAGYYMPPGRDPFRLVSNALAGDADAPARGQGLQ